jgi:four helix bundle protein
LAEIHSVESRNLSLHHRLSERRAFGLTGQIRRAGVSVASNIAEGYAAIQQANISSLGMARGSNSEVETQLVIAKELGYGNQQTLKEAEDLCIEVGKMLRAILRKL